MNEAASIFNSYMGTTPCNVIGTVFRTFATDYKTFFLISAGRLGCILATSVVFFLVSLFMSAQASVSIFQALSQASSDGSAARLLGDYYSWEDTIPTTSFGYNLNGASTILPEILKLGFAFLVSFFVYVLSTCYIDSAFEGVLIDAVARIHTEYPSSMDFNSENSRKIFIYKTLYTLATIMMHLIMVTSPAFFVSPTTLSLFYILYIILYSVVSCSMVGSTSAIVVEKKNAMDAFTRSWRLCASSFCFIFSNYICFVLMEFVIFIAASVLLVQSKDGFIGFLAFLFVLVAYFAQYPLNIIMKVTLYLTIRIRSEGLTSSQLQEELIPTINAVEMAAVDIKSPDYVPVTAQVV